jgi:hypothetical protein
VVRRSNDERRTTNDEPRTTNDEPRTTNVERRTSNVRSADLLETIVAATRRIVEVRQGAEPMAALAARAEVMPSRAGRFEEAVRTAEKAIALATAVGQIELAEKNRQLLAVYRAGKAYHEPAAAGHGR